MTKKDLGTVKDKVSHAFGSKEFKLECRWLEQRPYKVTA